ncbi:23S rRNA (adenine(2503)-C(2))-methyltransferase RlmN [Galbitalea sp. SE-J8]|uniref:23S rRNA (adenine(2503)-C(2))-methyltransferase RlmN n=1 Tax=Galbitalea sp. SE-J8 TaxID=3054952 RepID=UPI00259CCC69|nr:23S rRNA (adenine(2503)-C(2))-methyltransferase RlmN [Galbitalea sp. SE-J8]MDM4763039.1 23S rRNA (adenine(2503)-C(2))-methyltransferase RlmN [Galbitalea sp. SE-J8]
MPVDDPAASAVPEAPEVPEASAAAEALEGRPQVRPATEGWSQKLGSDGRPLLQFASPKRGKPPVHFADLTPEQRVERVKELGLPGFRAKQLATHYFGRYTSDPAEMTDLPATGREELVRGLLPELMTEVRRLTTDKGDTIKFLWKLNDGALVESVLMRYPGRITLCVSSQAGCGMNCPFCATGQAGLTRNMSAAEIVEQVVRANRVVREGGLGPAHHDDERVTNIVFMGMGEPLANYARLMSAVRTMVAPQPEGLGMSARHITVSTVGLVPAIGRLAAERIPVTFALSLHAPDDELRDELIPVNSRWKVDEALDAARAYFDATGRRVSIEYALIKDMNDHGWRAQLLADKLNARGTGWVHVNPIPLNPTPGSIWTASEVPVQHEFVRILEAAGVPTTIRDTRGKEIDGACGQLAAADETEHGAVAEVLV